DNNGGRWGQGSVQCAFQIHWRQTACPVLKILEISLGRLALRAQHHRPVIRHKLEPSFPSAIVSLPSTGLRSKHSAVRFFSGDLGDRAHTGDGSPRSATPLP